MAHRTQGGSVGILPFVYFCVFWPGASRPIGNFSSRASDGWGYLAFSGGPRYGFARHSGVSSTTRDEDHEARARKDIAVFPLATPLIAGPGAIGAVILLMANTDGDLIKQLAIVSSLTLVLLMTLALMLVSSAVQRLLGVTGMNVVSRIFGLLLTALAVQFVFDGIRGSGLLMT